MNKHGETIRVLNVIFQFFLETFVMMALGYFFGTYLDGLVFGEDKSILRIVFIVLAVAAGFRNLIKRALAFGKDDGNDQGKT